MKRSLLLWLTAFGLLVSLATLVAQLMLIAGHTSNPTARASANGIAEFCINSVPVINLDCNSTMTQNTSYYCQLNVTDAQGNAVTVTTNATIFNVTPNGTISFTPTNDHVGSHQAVLYATDNSGCQINQGTAIFSFDVANINDPPYLIRDLPDRQFEANTTMSAFYLDDYFGDPDGDSLNYTSTLISGVTITITPASEVLLTSSSCDISGIITFTATDPSNASTDSNPVSIDVSCDDDSSSGGNGNGESGGGGGGGGAFFCREKWECDEWLACLPTGVQWRRCYDLAGCSQEDYLKRTCEYEGEQPVCQENWLCKEWGECQLNQTQYRTCEDLNSCGSVIVQPPLEQTCIYHATCNDEVKNGDEEGVDCGGSLCAACSLLEQPVPITARLSTWLLIFIILAIIVVSGVLHYYRGQIAQGIATLGFLLRHRAYKDILLDAAQRKSFFERILAFEQLLAANQEKPDTVYSALSTMVRQYYVDAFALHTEAIPEELDARCHEMSVRSETAALAKALFAKLSIIEQQDLEFDGLFVLATTEELRTLVCLTSEYHVEELMRAVEELPVNDKMSFYDEIFTRSINLLRAVQFNQIEIAKKEYLEILNKYDGLSEQEKEEIYPELKWLFDATKFQSEITGAKVVKKPAMT
jgi:hypothetical protein